ncbi:MAG: glycosyltransferase [Patescibacteria group bacterium]
MKKSLTNLKVAVYYDWLTQWGGAERVLLDILTLFPQAEIFTLFHNSQNTSWLPTDFKIHTSFINSSSPLLSPFYDLAVENFNFAKFDLVISTTTNVGHSLLTPPQSLFICYYHNLNRHLYQNQNILLSPLLKFYQKIDYIYARRPDYSICNSQTVKKRLAKILKISAKVIHPGIDTQFFTPGSLKPQNYFLIVNRLVPHKKIDYAIRTFQKMPFTLKIVGAGRDLPRLKNIASSSNNIEFLGQVSEKKLRQLYQDCLALISPQLEDFGLASLEVQACGRPVIGYKKGGNSETIIDHKSGILYPYQNPSSLTEAIKRFYNSKLNPANCRQNSENFSRQSFMLNFKKEILSLCQTKKII